MKNFFFCFYLILVLIPNSLLADDIFNEDLFEEIPLEAPLDTNLEYIPLAGAFSFQEKIDTFRHVDSQTNFLSLQIENEQLGHINHLTLFPKYGLDKYNFQLQLGLPIRFGIYDFYSSKLGSSERKPGFLPGTDIFTPRSMDFVSFWDTQRVIQKISFGRPYQEYFLGFSRNKTFSFSQGNITKDFGKNWLFDHDTLFSYGHASTSYFRFEGFLGPFFKAHILGTNLRFNPFLALPSHHFVKNIALDIGYTADYMAPNTPKKAPTKNAGESFLLDDEHRLVEREKGTAQGVGITFSSNFMPSYWLNLKPYADFSQLILTNVESSSLYGAGFSLGNEFAFYLSPKDPESTLFFQTEGRVMSPYYWPTYFDSTYMLDRYSLNPLASFGKNDSTTKSLLLKNQDFPSPKLGYMLLLGYSLNDNFYLKASFEDGFATNEEGHQPFLRKFNAEIGAKFLNRVNLICNYQIYGTNKKSKTFDFSNYRKLLSLTAKGKILNFLYAKTWASHKFGVIDMYAVEKGDTYLKGFDWLSNNGEIKSFDFGLGVELALDL